MKPSSSSAKGDAPFFGKNGDHVLIEPGSVHVAAPGNRHRPKRTRPDQLSIKTYVILRRVFRADKDRPNVEILDVKLNLSAAEAIRDAYAGTWIERVLADKAHVVSEREQPGVQRVA